MKKYIPFFIASTIIIIIFLFFKIASDLNMVLSLPDFDPVTMPNIKSFSDWIAKSIFTLSLFYNFFQWLQKKAILSENNTDNQILTYLINFFSLNWFKTLTEQKKEEIKDEK